MSNHGEPVRGRRQVGILSLACGVALGIGLLAGCGGRSATETTAPTYRAGQTWSYDASAGTEPASLTVVKVETYPDVGTIVHVALDGRVAVPNPATDTTDYLRIAHLPFSEAAMDNSVTELLGTQTALPDYQDGYDTWREAFVQGEGGVYDSTVRETVAYVTEMLQQARAGEGNGV